MAKKFSQYISESSKNTEELRQAITTFVNFDVAQFENKDATKKVAEAFKTIVQSGDLGAKAFIEKILPQIKQEADSAKLTADMSAQSPEEAAGVPEEVSGEPLPEETPAEEAAETPEEETAEHAEGGSEAGTEAVEGETSGAPEAGTQNESYLVNVANCYFD